MSRAEKTPIHVASGVDVEITGLSIAVKGPKGQLKKNFPSCVIIQKNEDGAVWVKPADESRKALAIAGTIKSILNAMIHGVTNGFVKDLEISGVGFKAILKGSVLDLALGKSHPILYQIPAEIKVAVTDGVKIRVEGMDKQMVGQVAADIRRFYPVEPYKGKGVRIVGEFVRRKEGKKTA
ncbi:MAG: 50S ribosomal protein L6 [Puniceicoccales bacterium]|jgi:large subunit ribosomal protein L6|nr:50S ribosomal protein L6 [Puniceicoccales bacterium]